MSMLTVRRNGLYFVPHWETKVYHTFILSRGLCIKWHDKLKRLHFVRKLAFTAAIAATVYLLAHFSIGVIIERPSYRIKIVRIRIIKMGVRHNTKPWNVASIAAFHIPAAFRVPHYCVALPTTITIDSILNWAMWTRHIHTWMWPDCLSCRIVWSRLYISAHVLGRLQMRQ